MPITLKYHNELSADKNNIFIVSNILQLINAIEAQNHFQTHNNILVLLFYGEKKGNQKKIEQYLYLFPYSQLIVMDDCVKKNFMPLHLELLSILNKYHFDKLFTGFFSANIRRILCNLSFNEMYLLDDGTYAYALNN